MEIFDALLANPLALLIVMGVGAMIGVGAEKYLAGHDRARRRAYWQGRNAGKGRSKNDATKAEATSPPSARDIAADQLRHVMRADFSPRPLLNKPERRLLGVIDAILAEDSPGWRVMGQVALGEVLASTDKDAFMAINAKRVDLLLIDDACRPLHAIEFQGTGHHLGAETAARDAVKREALRRAGIGYVEVVSGDTPQEVRAKIRKLIGQTSPVSA